MVNKLIIETRIKFYEDQKVSSVFSINLIDILYFVDQFIVKLILTYCTYFHWPFFNDEGLQWNIPLIIFEKEVHNIYNKWRLLGSSHNIREAKDTKGTWKRNVRCRYLISITFRMLSFIEKTKKKDQRDVKERWNLPTITRKDYTNSLEMEFKILPRYTGKFIMICIYSCHFDKSNQIWAIKK